MFCLNQPSKLLFLLFWFLLPRPLRLPLTDNSCIPCTLQTLDPPSLHLECERAAESLVYISSASASPVLVDSKVLVASVALVESALLERECKEDQEY